MIDYDSFEEFYDPVTYDLECDDFDADFPVIEQWAQSLGSPLLDLACGTGRMSIHMARHGYEVTGVDIIPNMIDHAKSKAVKSNVSIDFVVADARNFHLNKQFPFIFMIMNAFQFLHTREDHEAMLACVREHLQSKGYFLFETRNPTSRNLLEVRNPDGENYTLPDGEKLAITQQQHYDPMTQIQHYTRYLKFSNGTERINRTALRYVYPQEMEALLHYNGFQIHTSYGNWEQDPLTATSPAMIYVCQKRK